MINLINNENNILDYDVGAEILDTASCYLLNQLVRELARRKTILD